MIHTLQRFWNDESGPELVEWAVVTIILLVAAVVLYVAVGKALGSVVCAIYCWVSKVKSSTEQGNMTRGMCDSVEYTTCETGQGQP